MSLTHMLWVLDQSQSRHGARLVLLALAEHANDEDVAYPAVKTLARRANLSERAVQDALRRLEEDGELEPVGTSQYGTTQYRLKGGAELAPGAECDVGGVQNGAENGAQTAPEPTTEPTTENLSGESGQLFEHDPVKEVFEHYCNTVPGKANSRLGPETRRVIKRALDERPIEQLKLAINGLGMSDFHLARGFTAIKYALGKTKEGAGDHIDMMAAKVPKVSSSGGITVDELLRTVPSDRHWIIRDTMSQVIQAIKRGERAEREEEALRRSLGAEPVITDGQFGGWRKVS